MNEELNLKPELDILKETLRELSVGDLYDLNPKLGDQLEQMGVSITREALADAIVDIKQTSIFQDKSIREKLLQIMVSLIRIVSSQLDGLLFYQYL